MGQSIGFQWCDKFIILVECCWNDVVCVIGWCGNNLFVVGIFFVYCNCEGIDLVQCG